MFQTTMSYAFCCEVLESWLWVHRSAYPALPSPQFKISILSSEGGHDSKIHIPWLLSTMTSVQEIYPNNVFKALDWRRAARKNKIRSRHTKREKKGSTKPAHSFSLSYCCSRLKNLLRIHLRHTLMNLSIYFKFLTWLVFCFIAKILNKENKNWQKSFLKKYK